MSLQRFIFRHSTVSYALSSTIAIAALSPAPSFIPTVVLLTATILYLSQTLPRSINSKASGPLLGVVFLLGTFTALSNLGPTSNAVPESIPALLLAACVSSSIAVLAVSISILSTRSITSRLPLEFILPPVWATTWALISRASPLGRIGSWSPIRGEGLEAYAYLRQYGGAPAIDFVVASFAVFGAQTLGQWVMGQEASETIDTRESRSRKSSHPRIIVAGTLALLTLPALLPTPTLRPVLTHDTTPFGVACIIPKDTSKSPFDAYMSETKQLGSRAKVIVWPEGAVRFDTPEERQKNLRLVGITSFQYRAWIAVSFEEPIPGPRAPGQRKMGRNGMALVGPSGEVVMEYYKRHLVPFVESFSQTPSDKHLAITTLDLMRPPDVPKKDWGSAPNFTRSITVTASICLDLSFPLVSLPSRPGLILAPARTWDSSAGFAMWNLARTRAEELGSTVLWCDGGEGGVSGLASATSGSVPEQVGSGSWSKQISLPYPFEPWAAQQTWYSWGGELLAIGGIWFIFAANLTVNQVHFNGQWRGRIQPSGWVTRVRGIFGKSANPTEDAERPPRSLHGPEHEGRLIDLDD